MQINNAPPKSATAFAENGTKNTIPEPSQISITPGAASFADGFPPLTMTPIAAGGVPPYGQDFNGILHFLSNAIRWAQMGAGYPFDAAFSTAIDGYPKGAIVRSDDGLTLWVSQADHNNTAPNAGQSSQWQTIPQVYSITNLPTTNLGPILVAEASEVWIWVQTAHYTGYRSPLCGRPVDGHTVTPLASEIDAVGGLLSKTAYAGLWGYAQENGLVVAQDAWADNLGAHWFVDVSESQFRVPDLRNQFRRYAGTDADSGNARGLGSRQADALQQHGHDLSYPYTGQLGGGLSTFVNTTPGNGVLRNRVLQMTSFGLGTVRAATETRPVNTAYHPRIHI